MISIDIGKINLGFALLIPDEEKQTEELLFGLLDMTNRIINTPDVNLKNEFNNVIKNIKFKNDTSIVLKRGIVLKKVL